ncbi:MULTISPECIES: hypothetical protein [Streptomyces]|uniref:Roadblock/LAMTOR2 domain-containing protein n=1 Tax=Streptomyces yangpuensis TaxID=1648182 RepID=A0ABY5PQA9_9ACTN|nr:MULTISPECIES: hypothetical protein [Streptomyces]MBZ9594229.1 hypothetical protein [Streptomyces erythrochromogenes]UUY46332.1 hypothetical protein NRK68_03320 [Streptomyces yangpuensis]
MPGIDECLLEAMALPGARGAALVDWSSGLALGTIGESPVGDHETTAAETAELARAAAEYESFARAEPGPAHGGETGPVDPAVEDLIVTTRSGFHVLRFVETSFDSSVFLHVWLDRADGNLALARLKLRSLAEGLVLR